MERGQSGETVSEARKAAILLSVMETEAARQLINQLEPEQRSRVVAELRELDRIDADEHAHVVAEFQRLARDPGADDSVEWDVSEQMLVDARNEPDEHLEAEVLQPTSTSDPLEPEFTVDTDLLHSLASRESPQAAAALLSIGQPEQVEQILGELSATLEVDIRRRMAHLTDLHPEVRGWLQEFATQQHGRVPAMPHVTCDQIPTDVVSNAEQSSAVIKEEMKVMSRPVNDVSADNVVGAADFDVLMEVEPRTVEWVLTDVAPEIWAIALIGASAELNAIVFQSAAPELMERVRRAMNSVGPVMLRDIDRAQQFILKSVLEYEVHQPSKMEQPVE